MPKARATHTLQQQVGRRIAAIRAERRLTQEKLAEAVGVTTQSIQRAESGRAALSLERLAEVARALGCEPADLLADTAGPIPKTPWSSDEQEAARAWARVPKAKRDLALRVLREFGKK